MIRSIHRFLIIGLALLLMFSTVSTVRAGKTFVEGFHVDSYEDHHRMLTITIDAIKRVDGQWRQSEVHIAYHYAFVDGRRDFEATVILSGDPDTLEVSKDLGWGGLDTVIQVQQRRVDCVFTNESRTCGAEIVETIPVELHVYIVPNEPYREEGGLFKRSASAISASVTGTIKTPQRLTTLNLGTGMLSSGYNFSDQFPG
jgi:hypothetical protein